MGYGYFQVFQAQRLYAGRNLELTSPGSIFVTSLSVSKALLYTPSLYHLE